MPKLAAAAVNEAIRALAGADLSPEEASLLEAFLVAKRAGILGKTPTIKLVNEIVDEIFSVLPADNGRIQPFAKEANAVRPKWGVARDSGRKTVWNTGTRTNARRLFNDNDLRHGLLSNAVTLLAGLIRHKPPKEALQIFLVRDQIFETAPSSMEAVSDRVKGVYGLTDAELDRFCISAPISATLGATPEWESSQLSEDLKPSGPMPTASENVPSTIAPRNLIVDPRIRKMVKLAILSSHGVILVGPPGTGKTALLREVIDEIAVDPRAFGLSKDTFNEPIWATPEEGWTARDLVGGETLHASEIRFRPGWVLNAIASDAWLVLDEANRADLDKIFGGLLTWLSGTDVKLGRVSTALSAGTVNLRWSSDPTSRVENSAALDGSVGDVTYLAGTDWKLLGTYNALDAQRVFRFGQALGRRFVRVPIPPLSPEQFSQALDEAASSSSTAIRQAIKLVYNAHLASPRTALGHALFLRMAAYVTAGLSQRPEVGSPNALSPDEADLLAEAYLINVGTWVARLDDEERNQLGARIIETHGALSADQWQWLTQLTAHLG